MPTLKRRVQLDFVPQTMARLDRIKARTEATSYVEVIKKALCLYEAIHDDVAAGNKIQTCNAHGVVTPFRILIA